MKNIYYLLNKIYIFLYKSIKIKQIYLNHPLNYIQNVYFILYIFTIILNIYYLK